MKKHIIILISLIACAVYSSAQDVSITLNNPTPTIFQGTEAIMEVVICNEDPDITLIADRIRPLVSFPNALIQNTAEVVEPLEDFIILVEDGQSIRFQNSTPIPPATCRTIEISYTGVNIGGPSTATGTMGFNGPQTPGNDISNDNSTTTITVEFAELIANDDMGGPINGYTGQTGILNVKDNDTVNGDIVDPSLFLTSLVTADPTGMLTLNADGSVDLAAQTPEGSNTLTYQICEIAEPTNCDTAIVTILVEAALIDAVNDSLFAVNGTNGGNNLINVFDNDLLNNALVIPSQVNLTEIENNTMGVLTLTAEGNIDVAANTPAGIYELTYRICEILNPDNCDDAVVVVEIEAAEIIANDDNGGPINGYTGQTDILNVLTNDLLNGSPALISLVTITELDNDDEDILLFDTDTGEISIAPQSPAGVYTLQYRICEDLNPTNCDEAIVTIEVEAADIVANDDTEDGVNGYDGQMNVLNVFDNDLLNGLSVDPLEITLSESENLTMGVLTLNSDGSVDVASQSEAGVYTLTYEICEILNPTNCDEAIVTITIDAADITAVDDMGGPVNGLTGEMNVLNVLNNDLLNGDPVNFAEVTLEETENLTMGVLTLNLDGSVDVAPNTPIGIYYLEYRICEVLNPTNCDTALVTINVGSASIMAINDNDGPIIGFTGENDILNVLTNDLLNGDPVDGADVTITELTNLNPSHLVLNESTGFVSITAQTPAGTYQLTYRICENLNMTNCSDATVTIEVEEANIIANDDTAGPINGYSGEDNVVNVLTNDLLNGVAVNPAQLTLTEEENNTMGVLTLNSDGSVDVAAQTPVGQYQLTYQICETLNPLNCDQAIVTVNVEAADIIANDDEESGINGFTGQENVLNVLDNDLLNGASIIAAQVSVTTATVDPEGQIVLLSNGIVNVLPQTQEGTYTLTYSLCEVLNPSNCDTAIVTIDVIMAEIVAVDDEETANGTDGGTDIINVLDNDLLNGLAVNPVHVNVTTITPDPNDYISLNADGSVDLEAGTPEGIYSITYEICEILNTDPMAGLSNCDTAIVTIDVFIRPDLTPTIDIDNLEFQMSEEERDFVVNIFEIEDADQIEGTTMVLRISKLSAYTITYEEESGISDVIGGIMNSNSDWTFTENSNFITATAKEGVEMERSGSKIIGFTIMRNEDVPSNTEQNVTATVIFGSAGEVITDNNTVETTITAN